MTRLVLVVFIIGVVFGDVFASNQTNEIDEQIVGGTDARLGQYPYQVSLRQNGRHFCGGTLVTNRHVVTAAHCIHGIVSPPFKDFTVVTGTVTLSSGGQVHAVKSAVYNPDFKPSSSESYRNDVAVVTLASPVSINANQKPIPLVSSDPPVGATLRMTGWGKTNANAGNVPNTLQTTTVNLLNNADCQNRMGIRIYPGQLCTYNKKGVGICMGDSGGPLVYNGQLVGIASFVIPCAKGYPDAYTRVSQYKSFINRNLF